MNSTLLIFFAVIGVFFVIRYLVAKEDKCKIHERIITHDGVIEIVDDDCQEGLPHTTGLNTIRMTKHAYHSETNDMTLKHERVHLDQKRHRAKWYDFYQREWEYELTSTPPTGLPSAFSSRLRPNPDTTDAPYAIWRQRWVFFPVYNASRTLKSAPTIVWDIQTSEFVDPPSAWKAVFCSPEDGCPHQIEHPHEIAAEYITNGSTSHAAVKLFKWFE